MAEIHDIEVTKKIVIALCGVSNIAVDASKDGFTWADAPALVGLFPVLSALNGVDFSKVLPEAKDLSPAEAVELAQVIKGAFNLQDDVLEETVEKYVSAAARAYALGRELYDLGVELFAKKAA